MTKEEVIAELQGIGQVDDDLYRADETEEQYAERMQRANYAVKLAATMLQNATIWTPCTERMPTVEDGGRSGVIIVRDADGSTTHCGVTSSWFADRVKRGIATHWSRITPIERAEG